MEVNGNGGNNVLQMPNTPNVWSVTDLDEGSVNNGHVLFTGIPAVVGGTDTDHFTIHPTGGLSIVSGGLGSNTLDYSLWTTPVRVNLAMSSASAVGNGDPNQLADIHHVLGGAGDDILIGNAEMNTLTGGAGRDLLIGREGTDTLDGGAGDNILIGGSTIHDLDQAALSAVMAEWTRTDLTGTAQFQYDTRILHLKTGRGYNGAYRLRVNEVIDDGAADTLMSGVDLDWYFVFPGDLASPQPNEQVN
jgi:Ca2+-binding RTX toxin-like protein